VVCSNDRKVFAKDMMASIYIQTNDTLQELVSSFLLCFMVCVRILLKLNYVLGRRWYGLDLSGKPGQWKSTMPKATSTVKVQV